MAETPTNLDASGPESRRLLWTKRILAGSFLFFVLKGLAWLAVAAVAAWQVL